MAKAIGVIARVVQPPERLEQKDRDKAFCDEVRFHRIQLKLVCITYTYF
jgi:hypothetical protein